MVVSFSVSKFINSNFLQKKVVKQLTSWGHLGIKVLIKSVAFHLLNIPLKVDPDK